MKSEVWKVIYTYNYNDLIMNPEKWGGMNLAMLYLISQRIYAVVIENYYGKITTLFINNETFNKILNDNIVICEFSGLWSRMTDENVSFRTIDGNKIKIIQ